MQSLALLIGSPLGGLRGVKTDLEVMQTILEANGFTTATIYPATSAQIHQEWANVTAKLSQGDAVVFYYSGHGGLAVSNDEGRDGTHRRPLQYLVPIDFEQTTEGDWRGIADVELSRMLRSATNKTRNVTLILDCCYAARMARLPGTVKAIDPREYRHISDHIERMLRDGFFEGDFHPERNLDVVTIAASTQSESAYEQQFNGRQMSVLVEALERTMQRLQSQDASPAEVSWRSIMQQVRDRVKVTCPQQSPRVEGDDLRFTFSLDKADSYGVIPVSANRAGRVVLEGGVVHGLRENDVYSLLPFHEEHFSPAKEIAEVVVTAVTPTQARARFEGLSRPTEQHNHDGMKAFLKKRQLGKLPVAVQGSRIPEELLDSITNSRFVHVADPDDAVPLATVLQDETRLQLYSHDGSIKFLLCEWQLSEDGTQDQSQLIDVELGRVSGTEAAVWSGDILTLVEGERFYLKISNNGSKTVYVSIFDLCADAAILVSCGCPTGYELRQGDSYTFGEDGFTGELEGSETSWPEEIPKEQGKIPEHLVIMVTDSPEDLRVLETGSGPSRSIDDYLELSALVEILSSRNARYATRESVQGNEGQEPYAGAADPSPHSAFIEVPVQLVFVHVELLGEGVNLIRTSSKFLWPFLLIGFGVADEAALTPLAEPTTSEAQPGATNLNELRGDDLLHKDKKKALVTLQEHIVKTVGSYYTIIATEDDVAKELTILKNCIKPTDWAREMEITDQDYAILKAANRTKIEAWVSKWQKW
ncbi:hypothetical protein ACJ41O_008753 [Fusarium nematophilum]